MYGFIHCALAAMIQRKYDETKWNEILCAAGIELDGGSYLIHSVYPDEETDALFKACSQVLGTPRDDFLEDFGCHFLVYCFEAGYDGILRVLGATLFDFLKNLDALHNHLALIYPGMCAPAFRCELQDEGHILLHYHSQRADLYPIAIGLVKSISKELFDAEVDVCVVREEICQDKTHVVILVSDLRSVRPRMRINSFSGKIRWTSESKHPGDSKISAGFFCSAFPFHLMFNEQLRITQIGDALRLHLRKRNLEKESLRELFNIDRPILHLTFNNVRNHLDNLFVLTLKSGQGKPLCLKGEMVHVPESKNMLFLCSPRARDLHELREQGLYLSDIPIHDKTREVLLLQDAGWMERELVEKLEETTNNLKKLQTKLTEDKNVTDDLVHSILPTKVAAKLRRHESIEADQFEMVTILYTDVVEFTALSNNEEVQPMDIIRLLNRLYSEFDTIVSSFEVFKVETIGDAYIVASSIPDFQEDHADRVLNAALAMMRASKGVMLPGTQECIEMRMGINSGSCIAGVVGKKMPRYCLFGNTITVSTILEGCSLPGKVTISEATRSCLVEPSRYCFEENISKDEMPCQCYFVTAKRLQMPGDSGMVNPYLPGMFCSPCPSPAGSRRTSTDMGQESSFLPDELRMSAKGIRALACEDRRATIGAKIRHYSYVEAMLRHKLSGKRGGPQATYLRHMDETPGNKSQHRLFRRALSENQCVLHENPASPIRKIMTTPTPLTNYQDLKEDQTTSLGSRRKPKPYPIQIRALATPVEIRLTPPPSDEFSDEETTVLEIDGEFINEESFSPKPQSNDFSIFSPKPQTNDYSIFSLPQIQETLERKLRTVRKEGTNSTSGQFIRQRRLSSSDSVG